LKSAEYHFAEICSSGLQFWSRENKWLICA
jgi:hypothetical protein